MAENMANCLINVLSAVIAVEYMDHGFDKRCRGVRRWLLFAAGCAAYFLVVTGLNHIHGMIEKYHGEYSCWEEPHRFFQTIILRTEAEVFTSLFD